MGGSVSCGPGERYGGGAPLGESRPWQEPHKSFERLLTGPPVWVLLFKDHPAPNLTLDPPPIGVGGGLTLNLTSTKEPSLNFSKNPGGTLISGSPELDPDGRTRERGGGNKSAWSRESIVSPSFPRYLICGGCKRQSGLNDRDLVRHK